MANTELVIKIPDEEYKRICQMSKNGIGTALYDWIANGVLLSKGHGKIIDATFALKAKITKDNNGVSERTKGWNEACQAIYENAQTIIEADLESGVEND